MPFLKKGKIFNQEEFSNAARKAQKYREREREKGNLVSSSRAKRPKYEVEIQMWTAMILAKGENPADKEGLGEIHENTLEIAKIATQNYRTFFAKKIDALSTGSIRLKPAFI